MAGNSDSSDGLCLKEECQSLLAFNYFSALFDLSVPCISLVTFVCQVQSFFSLAQRLVKAAQLAPGQMAYHEFYGSKCLLPKIIWAVNIIKWQKTLSISMAVFWDYQIILHFRDIIEHFLLISGVIL